MLDNFNKIKICVLGDIMLDRYISGYSERISPEAPVPVVKATDENFCLGGAGNVISNVVNLGAIVYPVGIIGADSNGSSLKDLFHDMDVSTEGIITSKLNGTITKTRVIANGQQVVRIDNEQISFNLDIENRLIKNIDSILGKVDLFIISDYGKGVCSQKVLNYIINESKIAGKPILVDPRKAIANFDNYKNCTAITPNFYETKSLLPEISNIDIDIEKSAMCIAKQYNIDNIIITRGSSGLSVMSKGNPMVHLSTEAKEVFDVSGAGDTVIATIGVCVAAGFDLIQSAKIANVAAGIVVSHRGTTPIKFNELNERLNQQL